MRRKQTISPMSLSAFPHFPSFVSKSKTHIQDAVVGTSQISIPSFDVFDMIFVLRFAVKIHGLDGIDSKGEVR